MAQKPQPRAHPVEVEIEGKRHHGEYVVEKGLLTVSSPLGGSKTTQLGSMNADSLARMLLSELVAKAGPANLP